MDGESTDLEALDQSACRRLIFREGAVTALRDPEGFSDQGETLGPLADIDDGGGHRDLVCRNDRGSEQSERKERGDGIFHLVTESRFTPSRKQI